MRILVTGGAGFLGSNFVHFLLDKYEDIRVITLDALTYAGSKEKLSGVLNDSRHEFVEGDICDDQLVSKLAEDVDTIVNFAAETHVDRSIQNPRPFVRTNLLGTQTLLGAALEANVDRFLQISTDEVYGQVLEGKSSETARLNPTNPYAATKAGADLLTRSYAMTFNIPILVARICNNYGPRQDIEKLIPKFIRNAAVGRNLPLYGDGSHIREWIYVDDTCRGLDLVLREGTTGEIYNIGSGDTRTNLGVTKTILELVGGNEDQITFVEDRPGHDQRYALDISKFERLGWEPEWTFEEGLKETVDYYI